jgi:hypothetical protein
VFLVNSRFPLVSAAHPSSQREVVHSNGPSFSRSYGGILPSSLTTVLSIALVFSTRPPELVWGTGTVPTNNDTFLGSMGSMTSPVTARLRVSGFMGPGFTWSPPYTLTPRQPTLGLTYPPPSCPCCPPQVCQFARRQPLSTPDWDGRGHGGTGISTGCASTTPSGLALAPDSPWED